MLLYESIDLARKGLRNWQTKRVRRKLCRHIAVLTEQRLDKIWPQPEQSPPRDDSR